MGESLIKPLLRVHYILITNCDFPVTAEIIFWIKVSSYPTAEIGPARTAQEISSVRSATILPELLWSRRRPSRDSTKTSMLGTLTQPPSSPQRGSSRTIILGEILIGRPQIRPPYPCPQIHTSSLTKSALLSPLSCYGSARQRVQLATELISNSVAKTLPLWDKEQKEFSDFLALWNDVRTLAVIRILLYKL